MRLVLLDALGYSGFFFFFFQAEDGIRDKLVTGVQTCALPISPRERLAQLIAQRPPERRVERRQRLVEQQERRVDRERPPERHPLSLAARKFSRVATREADKAQALDDFGAASRAFAARAVAQPESNVLLDP